MFHNVFFGHWFFKKLLQSSKNDSFFVVFLNLKKGFRILLYFSKLYNSMNFADKRFKFNLEHIEILKYALKPVKSKKSSFSSSENVSTIP